MASITISNDLIESGSDLISAYNDNVITFDFVPDDSNADVKGSLRLGTQQIYFTCYNYETVYPSPVIFRQKINIKELLRYFINDFYYKAVSAGINASDLITYLRIGCYGREDSSITASEFYYLYIGHGVNQIGNAYGGNLKDFHDSAAQRYTVFNDYPFEFYFYVDDTYAEINALLNTTLLSLEEAVDEGMHTIKSDNLDVIGSHELQIHAGDGVEKVTSWAQGTPGFDSFTSSGSGITSADETTGDGAYCETNGILVAIGEQYLITIYMVKIDPASDTPVIKFGSTEISFTWGVEKTVILTMTESEIKTLNIEYAVGEEGSFGGSFSIKKVDYVQEIDYEVKRTDCEGLYIRYLTKGGYYKYWLFNKYYKVNREADQIGYIYPELDTLIGAQARRHNVGYENAFEKVEVIAQNVSVSDQEDLLDLFTSPAVYLWNGSKGEASAETDWVLIDRVEGSHQINHKRNYQTFSAVLYKPELYTQQR